MSILRWLANRLQANFTRSVRTGSSSARCGAPALTVTLLEYRLAPAVLTVNSLADTVSAASSTLTLAEAVALVDSGGAAADDAGNSLAAAKASQINTANPFGDADTIQFAPGLFGTNPQQITLDGTLQLDRSVAIMGPGANLLAVSGDGQSLVFSIAAGATVSIAGVEVTGGMAEAGPDVQPPTGGGIVNNGMLTLTDVVVAGNAASLGGGIANNGTLTLANSTVADNTATNAGGILNDGALTATDSAITDNTAVLNAGINNTNGDLTLIESVVSGNAASNSNGGLANYGGEASLIDSTVSGNTAPRAGGVGNYSAGVMTLADSTVSDNSAYNAGGILNFAMLTVTDSTIADNTAVLNAGINNTSGDATLIDSVISGNAASYANGGLANYGGSVLLEESTVSGNTAVGAGGIGNYSGGEMDLVRTVVLGNSADNGSGIINTASLTLDNSTVFGFGINNTSPTLVNSTVLGVDNPAPVQPATSGAIAGDPAPNDSGAVSTNPLTPTDKVVLDLEISQTSNSVGAVGSADSDTADLSRAQPVEQGHVDAADGGDVGTQMPASSEELVSDNPGTFSSTRDGAVTELGVNGIASTPDAASAPRLAAADSQSGPVSPRLEEPASTAGSAQAKADQAAASESNGDSDRDSVAIAGIMDDIPGLQTALVSGAWASLVAITRDPAPPVGESEDGMNTRRDKPVDAT